MTNLEQFLNAYIQAALWLCNDDNDDPLGINFSEDDIAPESQDAMRADCAAFIADNEALLQAAYASGGYDAGSAGHDYWLTRCGHGAGFWDRGLGDIGEKLSAACDWKAKHGGNRELYVGDDGKIYYCKG
jgi:hypothetical protein